MADSKISALPAAGAIIGNEQVPIVQAGATVRAHVAALGVPAGVVNPFAGPTAPAGWLICDGAEVSRAEYPALFGAIGATWGAGNGSTTFRVPDLRGRAPIGAGTGAGLTARPLGAVGGSENMAYTTDQATTNTPTATTRLASAVNVPDNSDPDAVNPVKVYASGSGSANMPPYAALNFIIKT
jgi:microcystin-dependent protein